MRRCGSTMNGKTPAPSVTVAVAVSEGGKVTAETGGPMVRQPVCVGTCVGLQGGGVKLKKGWKKTCWKGGFPRVRPSNWPKTRSWKKIGRAACRERG